ncbi:hypothetical protein MMC25_001975 [Agyrium rufum]|nr:hypothetical protein [Agyrium rufum]
MFTYSSRLSGYNPPEATTKNEKFMRKPSEKEYLINDRGRVLKRSLSPDEYYILDNGEPLIPAFVVERLENEAACMAFIRDNTDIPVPKLLDAYHKDGSHYLWMEFIDGVEMSELTDEEQTKIIPQVQSIVTTLQKLRSRITGGPTGILSPPSIVYFHHLSNWKQQHSPEEEFVFCHGDLSQSNILVDPKKLRITAIIDWEYSGFYPQKYELPFYESPERSGLQVKGNKLKPAVDTIIGFWNQSQMD